MKVVCLFRSFQDSGLLTSRCLKSFFWGAAADMVVRYRPRKDDYADSYAQFLLWFSIWGDCGPTQRFRWIGLI